MNKKIPTIFWLLIINFVFILCQMFIPFAQELLQGKVFLIPFIIFFFLGFVLLILATRNKIKQPLKKYLLLTSSSAVGIFVFIILHNMFYALGVLAEDIMILKILAEVLHVGFFFMAVIIAPIGFVAGMIGGIKNISKI